MEESGEEYDTFCACYDDIKHKNTYFEFFFFSARMRTPRKIFFKSQSENGMTPPIFSLVAFQLVEGNAEFFSEKSSSGKVEGRAIFSGKFF